MRKWILFALVGLVLLYTFSVREGVDDTLATPATCPSGMTLDPVRKDCIGSSDGVHVVTTTTSQGTITDCPPNTRQKNSVGKCYPFAQPTCSSGYMNRMNMTCVSQSACDTFWSKFAKAVATGASLQQTMSADPNANICMNSAPPAWFTALGRSPVNPDGTPTAALKAAAATASKTSASDADYFHTTSYAKASGYADVLAATQDADNGPLPSAINERASSGDTDMARPLYGDVFATNGPFSGQLGTGQRTGTAAVAGMNGNTYGPPGQTTTFGPFDLWKGTKGTGTRAPTMPGTKMPVDGPGWGGVGSSTMSRSPASSQPAPALYGPVGSGARDGDSGSLSGWGYSQKNSVDVSMLPSNESAGSEPSNAYAVTSRVPGDMDMFPFPYIQSSSYSLANGSMKTDPVPFLTDFSAFQN